MRVQPHLAQKIIHDLLLCIVGFPSPFLTRPPIIETHCHLSKDGLQRRVWPEIDLRTGYPGTHHVGQFSCAGDGIGSGQQVID